jgi:hypothetical protein
MVCAVVGRACFLARFGHCHPNSRPRLTCRPRGGRSPPNSQLRSYWPELRNHPIDRRYHGRSGELGSTPVTARGARWSFSKTIPIGASAVVSPTAPLPTVALLWRPLFYAPRNHSHPAVNYENELDAQIAQGPASGIERTGGEKTADICGCRFTGSKPSTGVCRRESHLHPKVDQRNWKRSMRSPVVRRFAR